MTRLGNHALFVGMLAVISSSAAAQVCAATARKTFNFTNASTLNITGSVTIGGVGTLPMVITPSTFNATGVFNADVTVDGRGKVTKAKLLQGNGAMAIPDMTGVVPNPNPGSPPLATMTFTGSTAQFVSVNACWADEEFAVAADGRFNTMVQHRYLGGTLTVDVQGVKTVFPLAGTVSRPKAISGTLTSDGRGLDFVLPVAIPYDFTDPASKAFIAFSQTGNIRGRSSSLSSDIAQISVATGGIQNLSLAATSAEKGLTYLVLGSMSGTVPGFVSGKTRVSLNPDNWLMATLNSPNVGPLVNTSGKLSCIGWANAGLKFGPLDPSCIGLTYDHAFVAVDSWGNTVFSSNPVSLVLVK